jgi:hypothetical protein
MDGRHKLKILNKSPSKLPWAQASHHGQQKSKQVLMVNKSMQGEKIKDQVKDEGIKAKNPKSIKGPTSHGSFMNGCEGMVHHVPWTPPSLTSFHRPMSHLLPMHPSNLPPSRVPTLLGKSLAVARVRCLSVARVAALLIRRYS